MITNALVLTAMIFMILIFVLMGELTYLAPYKRDLVARHGIVLLVVALVLLLNLFAALFTLQRKLLLKDAGQKLSHLDKELQSERGSMSLEIRQKFHEE